MDTKNFFHSLNKFLFYIENPNFHLDEQTDVNYLYSFMTTQPIELLTNDDLNKTIEKIYFSYISCLNRNEHENPMPNLIDTIKYILNKITKIDDYILITICNVTPNLYKELVTSQKIIPSHNHLLCACAYRDHNIDLIQTILEYKVLPTHKCFEKILNSCVVNSNYQPIFYNYDYQISIINLLIYFGLTLDLSDVKKLAKLSIEIDIKKFDITPDEELINICMKNHFLPKYLNDISITQSQLHKLFFSYFENIKKFDEFTQDLDNFVQRHHLKYDITCLQNACQTQFNNDNIINYLIKVQYIEPDITCLKIYNDSHLSGTAFSTMFHKLVK